MVSDFAAAFGRVAGTILGAIMTFLSALLLLVYIDEGGTAALGWGLGLGVPGLVLLLGGAGSLLARLGIVAEGPVERLQG